MTVGAVLKAKDASVVSVKPSATVQEIAEIITSRRIGAVLVLDEAGGVVGHCQRARRGEGLGGQCRAGRQ